MNIKQKTLKFLLLRKMILIMIKKKIILITLVINGINIEKRKLMIIYYNLQKIRFFNETDFTKEDLDNKNILEVGSGAGRFTNIIMKYSNANLYSIDSSTAVYA